MDSVSSETEISKWRVPKPAHLEKDKNKENNISVPIPENVNEKDLLIKKLQLEIKDLELSVKRKEENPPWKLLDYLVFGVIIGIILSFIF